jgi:hypothetical protein
LFGGDLAIAANLDRWAATLRLMARMGGSKPKAAKFSAIIEIHGIMGAPVKPARSWW